MRTPCCHSFVAFILKFFNFLLTFIGISIIIYSAYMLNQWNNHSFNPPPPPSAPSPDYPNTLFSNFEAVRVLDQITPLNPPYDDGMTKLHAPAPWYFKIFICFDCLGLQFNCNVIFFVPFLSLGFECSSYNSSFSRISLYFSALLMEC